MRRYVATVLALSLVGGLACEGEGEKEKVPVEQGTVQSRTCESRVKGICGKYTIKVKYPDGRTEKHKERDRRSRKCTKGKQYPKCVGIRWVGDN